MKIKNNEPRAINAYSSQLIHLSLAHNRTEQPAPSVTSPVGLNINIASGQGLVTLQVDLRREDSVIISRHKITQIRLVQLDARHTAHALQMPGRILTLLDHNGAVHGYGGHVVIAQVVRH